MTNKLKFDGTYINVKFPPPPMFGARGDGATDDTAAIQKIYTEAANSKSKVIFPSGTYIGDVSITSNTEGQFYDQVYIQGTVTVRTKKYLEIKNIKCDSLVVDGAWNCNFTNIKITGMLLIKGYSSAWGTSWNIMSNIESRGVELDSTAGYINHNTFINIKSENAVSGKNLWLHGTNSIHNNVFISPDLSQGSYGALNEVDQYNTLINPYIENCINGQLIVGKWNVQGGQFDCSYTPINKQDSILIGNTLLNPKVGSYLPLNPNNLFPNGDMKFQPTGQPETTMPYFKPIGSRPVNVATDNTAPNSYARIAKVDVQIGDTWQGHKITVKPKTDLGYVTVTMVYKGTPTHIASKSGTSTAIYYQGFPTDNSNYKIFTFRVVTQKDVDLSIYIYSVGGTAVKSAYSVSLAKINVTESPIALFDAVYPKEQYAFASPTIGTWTQSDRIYNSNPTSGGYLGWVCVTSGTPGIWKGFGLIES